MAILSLAAVASGSAMAQNFSVDGDGLRTTRNRERSEDFIVDGGISPQPVSAISTDFQIVPVAVLPAEQPATVNAPAPSNPQNQAPDVPAAAAPGNGGGGGGGGNGGGETSPSLRAAIVPPESPRTTTDGKSPSAREDETPATPSVTEIPQAEPERTPTMTDVADDPDVSLLQLVPVQETTVEPSPNAAAPESRNSGGAADQPVDDGPMQSFDVTGRQNALRANHPLTASLLPSLTGELLPTSKGGHAALTGMTVAEAGILTRLVMIHRYAKIYESIPAFEAVGPSSFFRIRPGAIRIGMLIPPLPFFRRRKNTSSSRS